MNQLYTIKCGNIFIQNAPIGHAIEYAVQLMATHNRIEIKTDGNLEIHSSGCDKLIISPPLPEEYCLAMYIDRYLKT